MFIRSSTIPATPAPTSLTRDPFSFIAPLGWVDAVGDAIGTDHLWESRASFNPAGTDTTLTWSTPFQAGAQGPAGPPGTIGPTGPTGNGISGQSYDTATGILTLVFTDGGTFSTGDLRGAMGIAGTAATVTVGTVTTGAPGSSVIVTNRGTATAAILDFTIPQGAQGPQGDPGEQGSAGSGTGGGSGNAIPTTFNLPATGVDNELIRVVPPVVLDTGTRSAQSPFMEAFYKVVRGNGGRLYVAIPDSLPVVTGQVNPTIDGSRTISIFYSDTEGESIKFAADLTIAEIDTADNIVPIVSDTQLQPTWEGSGNVALITLASASEATTLRGAIPAGAQSMQVDTTNNADYFTDDNLDIYLGNVTSETFPTRGLYRWNDSNSMWNSAAFANDLPTGGGGTTSNATILNEVWRLGNAVARRTGGNIVGFNKIYNGRLATSSFVRSSTGAFQGTIYTLYDGVLTEDTVLLTQTVTLTL